MRLNGRVYEAVAARLARRRACDLYHSALVLRLPQGRFVIEQAPIRDGNGARRGVVAEGAVGSRWAARFRIFRYEVRRWREGVIPDVSEAVDSPQLLTDDARQTQRLFDLVPRVPTPVWGRDELGAGEMWNSNSVISWLIAHSGLATESIQPPAGGRAPGLGRWPHSGASLARPRRCLRPDRQSRRDGIGGHQLDGAQTVAYRSASGGGLTAPVKPRVRAALSKARPCALLARLILRARHRNWQCGTG